MLFLVCGLFIVCLGLFVLPLPVPAKLCSMIVTLSTQFLCIFVSLINTEAFPIHVVFRSEQYKRRYQGNAKNHDAQSAFLEHITKLCLSNYDPLKPHFNIEKLGFSGVCGICFISAQNTDSGYSLEPPRRGGSNEYPQSMFLSRNMKNIRVFYLNFYIFWSSNFLYI